MKTIWEAQINKFIDILNDHETLYFDLGEGVELKIRRLVVSYVIQKICYDALPYHKPIVIPEKQLREELLKLIPFSCQTFSHYRISHFDTYKRKAS